MTALLRQHSKPVKEEGRSDCVMFAKGGNNEIPWESVVSADSNSATVLRGTVLYATTPEPEMKYGIDKDWWEYRIAELEKSIKADDDMPPLIVHFVDGGFELNDGNHRHKAYENLGIEKAWVIVWITEEAERDDFMDKYGEYVKECKVIRR